MSQFMGVIYNILINLDMCSVKSFVVLFTGKLGCVSSHMLSA